MHAAKGGGDSEEGEAAQWRGRSTERQQETTPEEKGGGR